VVAGGSTVSTFHCTRNVNELHNPLRLQLPDSGDLIFWSQSAWLVHCGVRFLPVGYSFPLIGRPKKPPSTGCRAYLRPDVRADG
jgi:hypothetical protein